MSDALRRLLARPLQSLLSLLVLGAGLGTVAFCLTLVNGLILNPLPFPNADRLYAVGYEQKEDIGVGNMLGRDFMTLESVLHGVQDTSSYGLEMAYVGSGQSIKRYPATLVTWNVFQMLGIKPAIGRGFQREDDRPGAATVVLIGHTTWQRDYGGADVVGRQIIVNGEAASIIGVMPEHFQFPFDSQIWIPARLSPDSERDVYMLAQLAGTDGKAQLLDAVHAAGRTLGGRLDGIRAGRSLTAKPIAFLFVDEGIRGYVLIMLVASLLVLVIACANVANLQLAEAMTRQHEMAVRSALGAHRWHLMRDVVLQSLILSLGAAVVALLIAHLGGEAVTRLFTSHGRPPPYFIDFGIDGRLLAMILALALLTTLMSGLGPSIRATRLDLAPLLHDGHHGSSGRTSRMTVVLLITEIALTIVLLTSAAVTLQGLGGLGRLDIGTATPPGEVFVGRVELHDGQFQDNDERVRFLERIVARVRQDTEVVAASASTTIPGAVLGSHEYVGGLGQAKPDGGFPRAQMGAVDENFTDLYGITILEGQGLKSFTRNGRLDVALVDQTMARTLWPDRPAIGQTLILNPDRGGTDRVTVVGVIPTLQLDSAVSQRLPTLLVPLKLFPRVSATLAVHTRSGAASYASRLAELVRAENADVGLYDVSTQTEAIDRERLGAMVLTRTFSGLGIVALLLAMSGLYAIVGLAVTRRIRDIGIIRAMGARDRDVLYMLAIGIGLQLVAGLLLGALITVPWSALLSPASASLLSALPTILAVSGLVAAISALAMLSPMLRALKVDPMIAMHQE